MRWVRRRLAAEDGSALVEFVFIALVVFVPLIFCRAASSERTLLRSPPSVMTIA